ncbi:RNA polymerase sporulation sigma factor SigG [Paenibacillus tarimensis]
MLMKAIETQMCQAFSGFNGHSRAVPRACSAALRAGIKKKAKGIMYINVSPWEVITLTRNKVEICGVDTAKLPVLTNAEMRELFTALQTRNELAAREKLVNGNLRLVLSVIQRFNNRGEFVDDLFQVGCIGLMKAIDNFDLGQNVKFSTYAVPMIIGEIRRYLRDNNPIRVSRSLRDIAYKALQVRDSLTNQNSREPTIFEISEALNVPKEDVVFALDAIQDPVSLFEPIYHDGGDPIYVMDQISDDKNKDVSWIEEIALREAMHKLGDREKMILSMRFFEGKTQMEVADEIGISQAQVSRLEKSAIQQMQKHVKT